MKPFCREVQEMRLIDIEAEVCADCVCRDKCDRQTDCFVKEMQTVDAVPVIRCLECKYHYWEQEPCHGKVVHYCKLPHMRGVEVFKEFFCYYGERKEV